MLIIKSSIIRDNLSEVKVVLLLVAMLFIYLLSLATFVVSSASLSTLSMVQVIHRHGDRNPGQLYPKDQYRDLKFWPEGLGQLTNKGKLRMYNAGKSLHLNYLTFNIKSPRDVYVRSSSVERCLESAAYLLAGAFPPKDEYVWSRSSNDDIGFKWQAFPIQTVPRKSDIVLYPENKCVAIDKLYSRFASWNNYTGIMDENKELLHRVSQKLGVNITNLNTVLQVADALTIENERGYKHNWLSTRMLNKLNDISRYAFIFNYEQMIAKRLRAGPILQELTRNMQSTINKDSKSKKMYVYSTHGLLLASLMSALGVYDGQLPPYSSSLRFELHKDNKNFFIKLFYHNSTSLEMDDTPHQLQIEGCSLDCPVDKFKSLFRNLLLPINFNAECLNQAKP